MGELTDTGVIVPIKAMVLLGEAGVGKTITCKWLCRLLAESITDLSAIPLYVALGEWEPCVDFQTMLDQQVRFRTFDELVKVVQSAGYRLILFLDGCNELESDNIKRVLAFARKQTTTPKVLDLNESLEGMLKMLRRLIGEDIDLAWRPEAKVWPVKIDPSQIDQILANLCVNARDAISDVGQVTIETKNCIFDDEYCNDHVEFIPGEYVMLAVSDSGKGMTADVLDKIFEPFYTTKGLHQGTGLGLSTVYGIVKQNNGFINVYSEIGKGTTIKSYFIRHNGCGDVERLKNSQEIPLSQGETILLVEDDDSILKLGERMLNSLGYNVLSASTPGEAIKLVEDNIGRINLLLTDIVMPEMNGRELSEHLTKKNPDLKTLYMSGYTANLIAHRGVLEDGVCFIPKPLSKKELSHKVRDALDNGKV